MPEWKFVVYFSVIGKRKFCEHWLAALPRKRRDENRRAFENSDPALKAGSRLLKRLGNVPGTSQRTCARRPFSPRGD
jgi:hypothetical protein